MRIFVRGQAMRGILEALARGEISIEEAAKLLRISALQEIENFAKLDNGRELRKGIPEIVLAEGKTLEQVTGIVLEAVKEVGRIIISRATASQIEAIGKAIGPELSLEGNAKGGTIVVKRNGFSNEKSGGKVGILTAGTSDIPIAEEARIVAQEMGCEVITAYDVGVAGIHRLFAPLREMIQKDVDAIVVVAGREGALASVVAGLIDIPLIGVPTSFSWGLGEKGLSSLTSMLQACPLGLTVVNIDGGIAGGAAAALIANRTARARKVASSQL